jgi:hypothetical protein
MDCSQKPPYQERGRKRRMTSDYFSNTLPLKLLFISSIIQSIKYVINGSRQALNNHLNKP